MSEEVQPNSPIPRMAQSYQGSSPLHLACTPHCMHNASLIHPCSGTVAICPQVSMLPTWLWLLMSMRDVAYLQIDS